MTMTSKLSGMGGSRSLRQRNQSGRRAEGAANRPATQARAQSGASHAVFAGQMALGPRLRHRPGSHQAQEEEAGDIPEEAALGPDRLEPEADILRGAAEQGIRHRIGQAD